MLGSPTKNNLHPAPHDPPEKPYILSAVVQLLTEQGSAGFAEGIRLLVNEAMVRERSAALRAEPYQRSEARLGHSNGFKGKPTQRSPKIGKPEKSTSASSPHTRLRPDARRSHRK